MGEIGPVECWGLQERIEAEECLRILAFTIALADSSYAQGDSVMESRIKEILMEFNSVGLLVNQIACLVAMHIEESLDE